MAAGDDMAARHLRAIDQLIDEAGRIGAPEAALQTLGEALRRDAEIGASVAARFFHETRYVPEDNHELRKFFLQSLVEKAFYQATGELMASVVVFPELYYGDQGAPVAKRPAKISKKAREAKAARAREEAQADLADQEQRRLAKA